MGGGAARSRLPLGFLWKCLPQQKNDSVAMATQRLLCEAKSLGGGIISEMPGMGKFRGFLGTGLEQPITFPPPALHPSKHSLPPSFIQQPRIGPYQALC